MKVFEANISLRALAFLNEQLKAIAYYKFANTSLLKFTGIKHFFEDQIEFETLKALVEQSNVDVETDRTEFGDFQTNHDLANKIASLLNQNLVKPSIIIEPTCGKGSFIIAALRMFPMLQKIYAVEIHKPYVWETKFNLIDFFLDHPNAVDTEIEINHCNVFDFGFADIAKKHLKAEILIIGNPPWVTNSKLGSLESSNLPAKTNFKNHSGFDALTGKGNFDIGEYITLMMFDAFQNNKGHFAFLVKNAVIKNVIFDQKQQKYKISNFRKLSIDSKKEFNVSVEASLLTCKLNSHPEYDCEELDFYDASAYSNKFGWVGDNFVSDIEHYKHTNDIDGICQFVWRQGVKHDCSALMEFDRVSGHFVNGLNHEIKLEEDLVYGLLKSSDLKKGVIHTTRKYTIITQKKVGEKTDYIETSFPQTFSYLSKYKEVFDSRKSSIYKNKPAFSIFGIGDYSFKPFKVSISGLYKSFKFNLVLPQDGKPIMLDDTCYFIGFDKLEFAAYALILLNSDKSEEFLKSITFSDAKRTFTKDVLMRVDLLKLASQFNEVTVQKEVHDLNKGYNLNIQSESWAEFLKALEPIQEKQLALSI